MIIVMRDLSGRFTEGIPAENRFPVGAIRIRTRHKRNGEKRAFIKVADPNKWVLLAQFRWASVNGAIPEGFAVHHKDRNKLNDALENLELKSKKEHLAEHRNEFAAKSIAGLIAARKAIRWSTKSAVKRAGRHPSNCDCPIHSR